MLSVVAVLLSLTVCEALYVSPVQPLFHHVPLWVVRAVPGLPTSPVVLELPTEQEFVCPKDGTFPNLDRACRSYYNCHSGNVRRFMCWNISVKFSSGLGGQLRSGPQV